MNTSSVRMHGTRSAGLSVWQEWQVPRSTGLRGALGESKNCQNLEYPKMLSTRSCMQKLRLDYAELMTSLAVCSAVLLAPQLRSTHGLGWVEAFLIFGELIGFGRGSETTEA